MVIVRGLPDTTVPEAQSRALEQALRQRQVEMQYISYPGEHVFAGLASDQVRAILRQVVPSSPRTESENTENTSARFARPATRH